MRSETSRPSASAPEYLNKASCSGVLELSGKQGKIAGKIVSCGDTSHETSSVWQAGAPKVYNSNMVMTRMIVKSPDSLKTKSSVQPQDYEDIGGYLGGKGWKSRVMMVTRYSSLKPKATTQTNRGDGEVAMYRGIQASVVQSSRRTGDTLSSSRYSYCRILLLFLWLSDDQIRGIDIAKCVWQSGS